MDTKKPDDTNEMESENDKQTSSNIQLILDKLKTLPISNEDKSLLMNQFKQNILNPSKNENKTLEDIHNKYLGSNPMQAQDTNYINQFSSRFICLKVKNYRSYLQLKITSKIFVLKMKMLRSKK